MFKLGKRKGKKYIKGNKMIRTAGGLIGTGVTLGMGGAIVGKLPSSTVTGGVTRGLTTFGGFMPTFATITGTKIVMNQLGELHRTTKKFKRR